MGRPLSEVCEGVEAGVGKEDSLARLEGCEADDVSVAAVRLLMEAAVQWLVTSVLDVLKVSRQRISLMIMLTGAWVYGRV